MKVENRVLGLKAHIKINKYVRTTGISAAILLFLFSALSVFPLTHNDESAEATANPSTTTLAITSASNVATANLDVRSSSGTFASSSSAVAFSVITDNITGYSLSISGTDTTGKLVNTTIGMASLDSIESSASYSEFSGSSNTSYNGKWGIQPSMYNSVSNSNYLPAPTTDSITMDTTEGPNTSAKTYSIGLGARADYNTPSGTYTNTFVVQAVGRPVMYAINYLDNTGDDTVADLPDTDSSSTSTAVNFTLDSNSPTRDGYTFIGWCDGTVDHTSYPSTCDGDTYMPGSTYIFDDPSAATPNIANFYAMWQVTGYTITFNTVDAASIDFDGTTYTNGQSVTVPAGTYSLRGNYNPRYAFSSWNATAGTISNAEYVDYNLNTYEVVGDATITLTGQYVETAIQNLSTCTSTPIPTYDNRDNQVYWVKQLDDGNCWMMDNLNLGAIDLTNDLTSANTNLADTISASAFNGWRTDSGSSTFTSGEFITLTTANSLDGKDVDQTSGTLYGTLYNYCAASGGSYCMDRNSGSGDAIYDICPAGWRLPKGGRTTGSTNEFGYLHDNSSYDSVAKLRAPVSENGAAFGFNGHFNTTPMGQGVRSSHWSSTISTVASGRNMFGWRVDDRNVQVLDGGYYGSDRSGGYAIRCIRDTSLDVITYMQDVTTAMIDNMSEGDTITLKDKRDNEEYKLAKLKDGNLWMMDNLRLDPTAVSLDALKGNTNAPDLALNYFKNGGGSSPYPASGVSSSWTSQDQNSYDLPYISTDYKDTTVTATYGDASNKVGVYYNYCAASAGTYCYPESASGTGNATYDICPSGWRMPTTGYSNGGEYGTLYTSYSDGDAFRAALGTSLTGAFMSGTSFSRDSVARLWSSTLDWGKNMLYLDVNYSGVGPAGTATRNFGQSVRCIFNK